MPASTSRASQDPRQHGSSTAWSRDTQYEPWTPPIAHPPTPPPKEIQGQFSGSVVGRGTSSCTFVSASTYTGVAASTSAHDERITSTSTASKIDMTPSTSPSSSKTLPPAPLTTSRRGSLVQRPTARYEDGSLYEIRSPVNPSSYNYFDKYDEDERNDGDNDDGSVGDRSVRIPMLESYSQLGRRRSLGSPTRPRKRSFQDAASSASFGSSIQRRLRRSPKMCLFIAIAVALGLVSVLDDSKERPSIRERIGGVGDQAKKMANKVMGDYVPGWHDTSGSNGSTILLENGENFLYKNEFGGIWDRSPKGLKARAQSDTPPLSQVWDYEKLTISGVNLGGWLTLEPFITPYLYEPYFETDHQAVDEWTLSENLGSDLGTVLEHHYNTFITEKDFAEIAGAGLNWIRIPLPFWAIETYDGEPFLARVSWKYFRKAVKWARKYGLRINLDLHAVPGSQNGWNHSGKSGPVNFLNGSMGIANAQRTLNYIRVLSDFIALPGSGNSEVICMFSVLNEPLLKVLSDDKTMGQRILGSFYWEAYHTIRNITGIGSGHGPMITMHDGFLGPNRWSGFMTGADRIAIDVHRYFCFRDEQSTDPFELQATRPCNEWAAGFNLTLNKFGFVVSGEWSLATNDCGRFLNGVGMGSRFEGTFPYPDDPDPKIPVVGSCDDWQDPTSWNSTIKEGLQKVALGHMDTLRNWFFWTWKTGLDPRTGLPANPFWSYSLGLKHGYLPKNPRIFPGFCYRNAQELGVPLPRTIPWKGNFRPWMIGGEGAGRLEPDQKEKWGGFPSATLEFMGAALVPQYEKVGPPLDLPGGPIRDPNASIKDWYAPMKGCEYPGPWEGADISISPERCQPMSSHIIPSQ